MYTFLFQENKGGSKPSFFSDLSDLGQINLFLLASIFLTFKLEKILGNTPYLLKIMWQIIKMNHMNYPGCSAGKESACNVGDLGSIPGLGRSLGEGKGYPLQYSGLENPINCRVHGVTEWDTTGWLSFHMNYMGFPGGACGKEPNIHWKDWCWSAHTLATWLEELIPWKRPWRWERLKAGGEVDNRGWDGWMASLINGHEFEQTQGDGEGQGSLACCSS